MRIPLMPMPRDHYLTEGPATTVDDVTPEQRLCGHVADSEAFESLTDDDWATAVDFILEHLEWENMAPEAIFDMMEARSRRHRADEQKRILDWIMENGWNPERHKNGRLRFRDRHHRTVDVWPATGRFRVGVQGVRAKGFIEWAERYLIT